MEASESRDATWRNEPAPRHAAIQASRAQDHAQQAAQQSGIQYNFFLGSAQARSVAATAPPIVVPQLRIPSHALRGRGEILQRIDDLIQLSTHGEEKQPYVELFYGMGGIGKTALALEIAHRAMKNQVRVWWIPADESDGMRAALYALAFSLGARDDDFDHAHPADVLWTYLNALNYSWLLIIDNADDPAALGSSSRGIKEGTEWLRPPATAGNGIIISSRNGRPERWAPWINMRYVPPLSSDIGAQVLVDHAPHAGRTEDAAYLSIALGGVPLALELAGRYLASVATDPFPHKDSLRTFHAYRMNLDIRLGQLEMPAEGPGEAADNRRALSTTWEMSLDLLERQGHDLARPLLRLLACCGASPVPYLAIVKPEVLQRNTLFADPSPQKIGASLRALAGLGLISLDLNNAPEERPIPSARAEEWSYRLSMHPLVRTVTLRNLRSEGKLAAYIAVLAETMDEVTQVLDPDDASHWPAWSVVAPHCIAPLELIASSDTFDAEICKAALVSAERSAWYRYMAGQYMQACIDYHIMRNVADRFLGAESIETLTIGNNLARSVRENGDNRKAQEMLRTILAVGQHSHGLEHPLVVSIRLNLGRTLREDGQVDAAETEFRDLLQLARRVLGELHPDTINTALNLGVCLRRQSRFDEAETVYRKVLADWREFHSEAELTTLDIRFELAETMQQRGNFVAAETELRELLETATRVYGEAHPNTLIIRHGLAAVMRSTGRLDEAHTEFLEVLRLKRSGLGEDHPLSKATEAVLDESE